MSFRLNLHQKLHTHMYVSFENEATCNSSNISASLTDLYTSLSITSVKRTAEILCYNIWNYVKMLLNCYYINISKHFLSLWWWSKARKGLAVLTRILQYIYNIFTLIFYSIISITFNITLAVIPWAVIFNKPSVSCSKAVISYCIFWTNGNQYLNTVDTFITCTTHLLKQERKTKQYKGDTR